MSDNITVTETETVSTSTTASIPVPAQAAAPFQVIKPSRGDIVSKLSRTIFADLRRFSWLFMFGLTALACYHAVRLTYFDPRDYYAYQGTSGPFEYVKNTTGEPQAGRPLVSVQPGQRFAWVVNFCLNSGVTVRGHFRLVRLAQNGLPEVEVAERHSVVGPEQKRCGPLVNTWFVPPESLPGIYEVRRYITVRDGQWFPITQEFEPVRVTVSPIANPAPNPESFQPSDATPDPMRTADPIVTHAVIRCPGPCGD